MNKIDYTMANIVRKLKGKILGFSIENDKILNELKENANIVEVNILSNNGSSKGNIRREKGKTINYKKVRKFGHNKYDAIICDYNKMDRYKRRFISDSVYLSNSDIYIIISSDLLDVLVRRYKRYSSEIDVVECKDGYIVKVGVSKSKNGYFKDKFYLALDFLYDVYDFIGDILVN